VVEAVRQRGDGKRRGSPRVARRAAVLVGVAAMALAGPGCGGKPGFAGFLSSYDRLETGSSFDRDYYYRHETIDPFDYEAVIVEAVQVYFTEEARGRDLNEDALAELTTHFDEGFRELMDERFDLAAAPGEGVARVRIAVTDVRPSKPLFDIVPHSKILGLNTGGATIEAEMLDSVTGEQILAVVDRRWGNRLRPLPKVDTLDDARKVIDEWMRVFRENLEEWEKNGTDDRLTREASVSES